MKDKELDKLFKGQLEQHSVSPKKDIWHKIESQLDQPRVASAGRFSWIHYAAIAIGCLGLIALVYNMMQPTPVRDIPTIAQKGVPTAPANTWQDSATSVRQIPAVADGYLEPSEQEVTKTQASTQHASRPKQRRPIKAHLPQPEEPRLELVELKPAGVSLPLARGVDMDDKAQQEYVITVPPVAPLIDSPETEESMLASTRKPAGGIVPGILNKISDALNPSDHTTIQFSKDEEGFLRLDIVNSLVKNRNKKRR
ncbi:hypothetical protein [Sphingobacterium arenae]|uniref:Energy transducer TonB n=1 Tax=Sphingobacterium arenae TaxID=1280598 RepID=A0ABR7Y8A6_9SPHI|nr:hypothetical protein [Sphingobacterium arenae]MBD1427553.1 hypothetical protein [Sphingobacterium arenae]